MRMPEGIFFIIQATSDESWTDMSQRILNVLMPDTVIPIHRHNESSETVIICRGKVREEFWRREVSVLVCRFRWEFTIHVSVWSPAA